MLYPVFLFGDTVPDILSEFVFIIPASGLDMADRYRFLHETKARWAFYLSSEEEADPILPFLFLPSYYQRNGHPLVLSSVQLTNRLDLGWEKISYEWISIDQLPAPQAAASYYQKILSQPLDVACICIRWHQTGDLVYIADQLHAVEETFRLQQPELYEMTRQRNQYRWRFMELQRNCALAEQEIEHLQTNMEILRSEHQAREIQEYYYHEYEVLPLWFKRLGHLVKVATGKRSLKSIFDDRYKKNK